MGITPGSSTAETACTSRPTPTPTPAPGRPGTGAAYVFCDEVDAYFAEITQRGAATDGPPRTYDYGMRDFMVRDLDGNQLSFGSPVETG
ncbi:MAG: VOC family protein [Planctomycetota bacterium]